MDLLGVKSIRKRYIIIFILLIISIVWVVPTIFLIALEKNVTSLNTKISGWNGIYNIANLYEIMTEEVIYTIDLSDNSIVYNNNINMKLDISNFNKDSSYNVIIKIDDKEYIEQEITQKESNFSIELENEGQKGINIVIYKDGLEKVNKTINIFYIEPYKTQFLEELSNKGIKVLYKNVEDDEQCKKTAELISNIGVKNVRIAIKGNLFANQNKVYDLKFLNQFIEYTKNSNIKISSGISEIGAMGGENKKIDTDEELEHLLDLVTYVITNYPEIENLEILNEPNYLNPTYKTDEEIKYYAEMVKKISEITKEINPDVKIIAGSVACNDEDTDTKVAYNNFLNKITQYGAYKYANAYSYHPYEFYKSNSQNVTYYKLLSENKNLMNNYGGFLENYITEYGVSNYTQNNFSEDEQAVRLVQQSTINDNFGVELSLIYDFWNVGTDASNQEHNFGLVNNNYTPKRSYYAMKNYYENTNGAEYVGTINIIEGLEAHVYNKDGKPKIIAWSDNKNNPITIPYEEFVAKDIYGNEINSEDGTLTITTSPVYLDNIDKKYFYQAIANTSNSKYDTFKEKFAVEIEQIPNLADKINELQQYIQNVEKANEVSEDVALQLMELHYNLGDLILDAYEQRNINIEVIKISSMLDMLDDIGDSYEDLITVSATTANVDLEQTKLEIENIEKIINENNDVDITYPKKILDISKNIYKEAEYINSLEEENAIKLGLIVSNNLHSRLLANWANKFATIQIEQYIDNYISENPVTINYSKTDITNEDVIATIETNAEIQIINNSGNNRYIFKENGEFTFQYMIKGKLLEKTAKVTNIDKYSPKNIGVENG